MDPEFVVMLSKIRVKLVAPFSNKVLHPSKSRDQTFAVFDGFGNGYVPKTQYSWSSDDATCSNAAIMLNKYPTAKAHKSLAA